MILLSLFACEKKVVNGILIKIEVDYIQVENLPPFNEDPSYGAYVPGHDRYNSWEEAYAKGWKSDSSRSFRPGESNNRYSTESKPTGFVIVLLEDGTKIRCKNPFPDLSLNQKVKVKETATGDWVITK